MMSINSIPQVQQIPQQTQPVATAPAFKGDDSKLAKAIEENTAASNTTAKAALITSCATLLPLSVLAYKTHNLGKVAEAFQNDAKPILEKVGKAANGVESVANGAKVVVKNLQEASGAAKDIVVEVKNAVGETTAVIKSEELKGLINELTGKIHDVNLAQELSKIGDSISGKINEIDPKVLNDFIAKLSEFDVKGLSDNALGVLNKLSGKIDDVCVKMPIVNKKSVPELAEKIKDEAMAEATAKHVEDINNALK